MAELKVYAEVGADNCSILFTFDPPGYLAHGKSIEDALKKVSSETRELREFLQRCNKTNLLKQIWEEDDVPQIKVVEVVRNRGKVAEGYTRATFSRDYDPVMREESLEFLSLMKCMREELISFRTKLDSTTLRFRPSVRDMTISEHLKHIASCDRWYLSRFWDDLPRLSRARDEWQKLYLSRKLAVTLLSNLNREDAERTRKVNGEVWTARKLFRRFLYHERFHINCIRSHYELLSRARFNDQV